MALHNRTADPVNFYSSPTILDKYNSQLPVAIRRETPALEEAL